MKKEISSIIALLLITSASYAQQFGLSFSYFIPKNGYFSTPISPFSIRGLGVNLNQFMALETGASLYRMSGLSMKGLPFESKEPLVGPNFTVFIPAEFVIMLPAKNFEFDIKAGGFFFYGLGNKINYGNFDRAIREYKGWQVANADLSMGNNPGFGYQFGGELTLNVTSTVSVALETSYLVGQAKLPVKGTYTGGSTGTPLETENVDYKDAKLDFTGLEFSISLLFDSGSGPSGPKKKKRRR